MKDSPLTKNGVILLYDSSVSSSIKVQVVYSMLYHNHYYARLSDGKQLSPMVRFPKNSSQDPPIFVGHVLDVNQAKLMKSDPALSFFMDGTLPYLFILAFSVVEQTDSLYGEGMVSQCTAYYPSIKRISHHLVKFDHSLRTLLEREETRLAELSSMGDQMRERGNALFKKGLYKQAAACYESASRLKVYDDRIFSNQSLVCFQLEEFSKALMLAMCAIKLNPFNIKAYYRACQCLEETKEHFQLFIQKRAWRIVCGASPDMDKFPDRDFSTLIPLEQTFYKGPSGGGGRARSQSVAKGGTTKTQTNNSSSDKKAAQTNEKKSKASDDKKKKSEHVRDVSKASEKGSTSNREAASTEKKHDSHLAEKKKSESEPMLAPGYSNSGKDFACISVLKEGRKFYREAKYDQALDFYRTAVDSGLVSHRPKNEQKRLSFIVCLCLVETGSVQNCITALKSLKTLLPASPAAVAAPDDDSDLPRAPVYYLLTMAYHRTWQYTKVTSFAALFNRWFPKDKQKLPLHLPAFMEPITHTEVDYLEKWYAEKPWLKSDELVVVDTCRYSECDSLAGTGHHKHIVQSADLYTGHVELSCEESCHIFYHPACWRVIKDQKAASDDFSLSKNKLSDKDFLSSPCLTPDCTGSIERVRIFDENESISQEFIKERSPSEAKPKKKKNKKKTQPNNQFNKGKNDPNTKDLSKAEVSNSENTSKDARDVPEPMIKKSKGVSKPGSTLPLDELDFQSCNVKVIKREPLDADDTSKRTKKEKKNKKQRALDVERLVPDITDSPSVEQNEYLAKIRRLNAQKEALERSVDCASDQEEEGDDDDDDDEDGVDPSFYSPSLLQSDPNAVTGLFTGRLNISSKYLYSRELNIPTQAKIEALLSFLEDFIVHEGPLKINDREFHSYIKENLPPESMDCISVFGGVKEFLNSSPKFVILDDYVSSVEHVGYVQELVYADIVRDVSVVSISDEYQARTYLEPSPLFHSSSESSLTSESGVSVPSSEPVTKVSPEEPTDVGGEVEIGKSNSAENLQFRAPEAKAGTLENDKSSRSGSECSNSSAKAKKDAPANKQVPQTRDSVSSVDQPAPSPSMKDSSTETESSGLDGGFQTLFNDDSNNRKERQLEKQVVKLQRKLDEVLKERNSLSNEVGNLQQKFSDLSHKMGVEVATLKEQLSTAEENVQSRYRMVDKMKAESSTEQRRLNAEKKKLSEENKTLVTKVNALEVREDCLKDEKRKLEQELEHINASVARQTEQLTIVEASLTSASGRSKTAELGYIDLRSSMIKDIIHRALEFYQAALSRFQELHCRASVMSVPSSTLLQQQIEILKRHCDYLLAEKHRLLGQSDRLRVLINNGRPLNDTMRNSLGGLPDDMFSVGLTDLLALTQDGTVLMCPKAAEGVPGAVAAASPVNQGMSTVGPLPAPNRILTIKDALFQPYDPKSVTPRTSADVEVAVAAPDVPKLSATNSPAGTPITTPSTPVPEVTPSAERQISVGNLPTSISEHQLKALFSRFGEVDAAEMLPALHVAFITFKLKRDCLAVLSEIATAPLMFGSSVLDVRPVTPSALDSADQAARSAVPAQERPLVARTPTPTSPHLSQLNSAVGNIFGTYLPVHMLPVTGEKVMASGSYIPSAVSGAGAPAISGAGAPTKSGAGAPAMSGAGVPAMCGAGVPAMSGAGVLLMPSAGVPAVPSAGVPAMPRTGVPLIPGTAVPVMTDTSARIKPTPTIPALSETSVLAKPAASVPAVSVGKVPAKSVAVSKSTVPVAHPPNVATTKQTPTPTGYKAAPVTNKSVRSIVAEQSAPSSTTLSNNVAAVRSSTRPPNQMPSAVHSRVSSPAACAPSPSHDHSQLSHFGVKPKVTNQVAPGSTMSGLSAYRASGRSTVRAHDVAGKRNHERLADICQETFGPKYSREAILEAIAEVRHSNNNRLSGLAEDVIIQRVKQLVHPKRSKGNSLTPIAPWANAAQPAKPDVTTPRKVADLENEDCIICFNAMKSSDKVKILDCNHFFHAKCINNWFSNKRECPLCRRHDVDKEEYPPLSSTAYAKH